jgi:fatty acid CoA ligase FadD36
MSKVGMAAKLSGVDLIPWLSGAAPAPALGPLLSVDGRTLSAEDLAGAAGAVAARVSGRDTVAVHADASVESVVAVVGSLMAGVAVVPVPADAGPAERRHILADSGSELVLNTPAEPVDLRARATPPPAPADPERTALVMYTSGTTGPPKGVELSARAIAADLDLLAEAWEWTAEDVLVHGLPLFHVHGLVLGVLGPLRLGGRLIHTGRPTPTAYAEAAGSGGTVWFGVPTVWSRVAADPSAAAALRGARLLVSGSAGLPARVFGALKQLCGRGPIERYGMTETLITVSGRPAWGGRPGWVGRPLPGVATRLVDDGGRPIPADGETVGSLEVRTPTAMSGYRGRPADTAAVTTTGGWIRTGDMAVIAPDGWHRIVGRRSADLIKSGGYRIGAGEVEAALLEHPAVADAAVVGEPDADLGQVVVAYVVARGAVSGPELADFVAANLSVHKRPRRVVLVDDLPRNPMGKVQKHRLAAPGD